MTYLTFRDADGRVEACGCRTYPDGEPVPEGMLCMHYPDGYFSVLPVDDLPGHWLEQLRAMAR